MYVDIKSEICWLDTRDQRQTEQTNKTNEQKSVEANEERELTNHVCIVAIEQTLSARVHVIGSYKREERIWEIVIDVLNAFVWLFYWV